MILYSTFITPRLQYMANWLGNYLFNSPLPIYNDAGLIPEQKLVLNYSSQQLAVPSFTIVPNGLLQQTTIRPLNVGVLPKNGLPGLVDEDGRPMDLLSSVFYLISRYEEYLPHKKDAYGRYAYTNSIAFRNGFLNRPLIDEWMTELKSELKSEFPSLEFATREFRFIPSYDVDIAWSYKNKEWIRIGGGFFKDLVKGSWQNALERAAVLNGKKTDPFDVFDELDQLHEKYHLQPHYFILLAQQIKNYDKNISPYNKAYRALIRNISGKYPTGIHLSWQSAAGQNIKRQEINLLEEITSQKPVANRMHYINFHLPHTFEEIIDLGITNEYSMGYGSINGFRASTCTPYYWYNLSKEIETSLEIFPYCYMEANSIFEQEEEPATALKELQHYKDIIKQHGGLLITIFHNHLIGSDKKGRSWMQMYCTFLQDNFSGSLTT